MDPLLSSLSCVRQDAKRSSHHPNLPPRILSKGACASNSSVAFARSSFVHVVVLCAYALLVPRTCGESQRRLPALPSTDSWSRGARGRGRSAPAPDARNTRAATRGWQGPDGVPELPHKPRWHLNIVRPLCLRKGTACVHAWLWASSPDGVVTSARESRSLLTVDARSAGRICRWKATP